MKALILTNEYPPNIYGGAGVHVEFLSRELARLMDVEVRAFGDQHTDQEHLRVRGYGLDDRGFTAPPYLRPVFGALARNVAFAATDVDADVVHTHTWYANFGGLLIKHAYDIPLVMTTHSLEPLRPWKREQLRGGYDLSNWIEGTSLREADAVIAVSEGTRADILRVSDARPERVHVIYNGIDTALYRPTEGKETLARYGIDPNRPFVLFVGRITRQKGIIHLVRALPAIDPDAQIVLCAGAPDTQEIAAEMSAAVATASAARPGVIWIRDMLPREDVIPLYSAAAVFCCPSIYEPFGIINLEAMACGTPVVASAVGGIKEVVVHEKTGLLVPFEPVGGTDFEPRDPAGFARDLAAAVNSLLDDPEKLKRMGLRSRERVEHFFSWTSIARWTTDFYWDLVQA